MPALFINADGPADDPHPSEYQCQCEKPDDQYTLEIDCGDVILTHTQCGKTAADWLEETHGMAPIPVTLKWFGGYDAYSGEYDGYSELTINVPRETSEGNA